MNGVDGSELAPGHRLSGAGGILKWSVRFRPGPAPSGGPLFQGTAAYTIRVRGANGEFRPLGDIGEGAYLGAWLATCMRGFELASSDKTSSLSCAEPVTEGDETFLVLEHRQSGMAGDIVDKAGRVLMSLSPDHTQRTKHAVLFRLPPLDVTGYLATLVGNGPDVEALLEEGIRAQLGTDFPRLGLEIWPFIPGLVFRRVVEEEGLKSATYVRYEQPSDQAVAAVRKWEKAGTIGKFDPGLGMRSVIMRTRNLMPGHSARDEARASSEIVELHTGSHSRRIEIEEEDGTGRNFLLRQPPPAVTEETTSPQANQGAPTEADLLAILRHALRDASC